MYFINKTSFGVFTTNFDKVMICFVAMALVCCESAETLWNFVTGQNLTILLLGFQKIECCEIPVHCNSLLKVPGTLGCLLDCPPPLINFLIFFHPGHSYSNPLPINYWGKFPNQTNFLKQYTCADFFAISQKERPVCSVFYFVSSCKEAKTFCFVF